MSSGGAGGNYNLTMDGELRYIVQWFEEWSDFQREDFVPYVVSYLASQSGSVNVNGIISGMAQVICQDKPMSLFQCRVKLFNEWSAKWPEAHKEKLLERLQQIDELCGDRIQQELATASGDEQIDTLSPPDGTVETALVVTVQE